MKASTTAQTSSARDLETKGAAASPIPPQQAAQAETSTPDSLSILTASGPLLLAKTWLPGGDTKPYDDAKNFKLRKVDVSDIHGLHKVLQKLSGMRQSCIIRGGYIGDELAVPIMRSEEGWSEQHVLRKELVFKDRALHSVMIDVDKFKPAGGLVLTDPTPAIDEFIAQHLPECFYGRTYHWQLSSSAGLPKNEGVLKVHLWFWLDTAYTSAELIAWRRLQKLALVDEAVFRVVQPLYTANPIMTAGVSDPVAVRSGLCEGVFGDTVPLAIDTSAQAGGALAKKAASEELDTAIENDAVAQLLYSKGMVLSASARGRLYVQCPRQDLHTDGKTGATACAYFPAFTNGYRQGNFRCLHASCEGVPQHMFTEALGISVDGRVSPDDAARHFDNLDAVEGEDNAESVLKQLRPRAKDDILATWPRLAAGLSREDAAVVVAEVERLTGAGRRLLNANLREAKASQMRERMERDAGARELVHFKPENSAHLAQAAGLKILEKGRPEDFFTYAGRPSKIVETVQPYAHMIDAPDQKPPATMQIEALTPVTVRAQIEQHVIFQSETGKGPVNIAVPGVIIESLIEMPPAGTPAVTGLLCHPIVLRNGSILAANGLDVATGLYVHGVAVDGLSAYTREGAAEALARLESTFLGGFSFASKRDRHVAIAGLFTAIERRALDSAPGLAILAAVQSSGKTTLARRIFVMLTGKDMPVVTLPVGHDDEIEKRLLALLLRSPAMITFDNVPDGLTVNGGAALNSAITAPEFEGRLLGNSRMLTVPSNAFMCLTGNNLGLGRDEVSRWLTTALAPPDARPESRVFKNPDVVGHARSIRCDVLRDVVGIVSGFLQSGDDLQLKSGSRFVQWDRLVRQPLMWAGADDPAVCFEINADEAPDAQATRRLVRGLLAELKDETFNARRVVDLVSSWPGGSDNSRDMIEDALRDLRCRDVRNSKSVGRVLTIAKDRPVELGGQTYSIKPRQDGDGISFYQIVKSRISPEG